MIAKRQSQSRFNICQSMLPLTTMSLTSNIKTQNLVTRLTLTVFTLVYSSNEADVPLVKHPPLTQDHSSQFVFAITFDLASSGPLIGQ